MSPLLRGYLCFLGLCIAGVGAMFANQQMKTWPRVPDIEVVSPQKQSEFPLTQAAMVAGQKMGLALEWQPEERGKLAIAKPEKVEAVNRWLAELSVKRVLPRTLSLTAAPAEGHVIINNIGFD